MMNSKEFIKSKIKQTVSSFPSVKCSYRYDDFCETHYIEVLPKEMFRESERLIENQADLLMDFIGKFPEESLVFLTEGDLIKLGEPEHVQIGCLYNTASICWYSVITSELRIEEPKTSEDFTHETSDYSLAA